MIITPVAIASRVRLAATKLDEKARIVFFSLSGNNALTTILFSADHAPDAAELLQAVAEKIPEFDVHIDKINIGSLDDKRVIFNFGLSEKHVAYVSYMPLTPPENKPEAKAQPEQTKPRRKTRKEAAA